MTSLQEIQHSLSKYSFTTNEKKLREKSFVSCFPSQKKTNGKETKIHIEQYINRLPPSRNKNSNRNNKVSSCKTMREVTKLSQESYDINYNKRKKYFFVPNINKMKHLDSDIIDSVFTFIPKAYQTISNSVHQNHKEVNKGIIRNTKMKLSQNSPSKRAKGRSVPEDTRVFESFTITELDTSYVPKIILKPSKIVLANVNESRKDDLLHGKKTNNNKLNTLLTFPSIKRSSLIDRLIIKVLNPMDCVEDYDIAKRPGDMYKRFRGQLVKTKDHIHKLVIDIQRSHNVNKDLLKIYASRLKSKIKKINN